MKSFEKFETSRVAITAGMGCRKTSLGMLSLLSDQCSERGLPAHFVDGSFTNADGVLEVSPPSTQLDELKAYLDTISEDEKTLIISHCGGATAVIDLLEQHSPSKNVKGLLIAPPFETPADTIALDEVQRSIVTEDGRSFLDVYDTPSDDPYDFSKRVIRRLAISRAFDEEVVAASQTDFMGRAKQLATDGVLGIVVPQDDWNVAAVRSTMNWPGPIMRVDGARHSLRMPSDTLESQRQACDDAVNFGLSL